jgi:hypothetical protein
MSLTTSLHRSTRALSQNPSQALSQPLHVRPQPPILLPLQFRRHLYYLLSTNRSLKTSRKYDSSTTLCARSLSTSSPLSATPSRYRNNYCLHGKILWLYLHPLLFQHLNPRHQWPRRSPDPIRLHRPPPPPPPYYSSTPP